MLYGAMPGIFHRWNLEQSLERCETEMWSLDLVWSEENDRGSDYLVQLERWEVKEFVVVLWSGA
jgi:hypothetical protein